MDILAVSAIGDALGAAYEFGGLRLEADEPLVLHPYGGYGHPKKFGEWTDDTSMALCISIAANNYDLRTSEGIDAVGLLYTKWSREYPAGIGGQTRSVLDCGPGPVTAERLQTRAKDHLRSNPDGSAGNGSLMRVHPVALLPGTREEVAEIARQVTMLTHADERCLDSSVLWVEMLRVARSTGGVLRPLAGIDLIPSSRRGYWQDLIFEAVTEPSEKFGVGPWWVVSAFQQALSAVHKNLEYVESEPIRVFEEIVRVQGCDTDTVCAIAGGLMGALGTTTDMFTPDVVDRVHGRWPRPCTLEDLKRLQNELTAKERTLLLS